MNRFTSIICALACLALASSGIAQGHGKGQDKGKKSPIKAVQAKSKHQMKVKWDDDPWWKSENDRIKRDLKLKDNQGSRISAINKWARDEIHAAHASGLRGTALSNRIRQIRAHAKSKINAYLSVDQRRTWDWRGWERRWDDQWSLERIRRFGG